MSTSDVAADIGAATTTDQSTADESQPHDSGAMATPSPPPGSQPRRSALLGGVAGLVAQRLSLDPLWVRLFFVVTALVGGIGVVAYLGLWLLLRAGDRWPQWTRLVRMLGGVTMILVVPAMMVLSGVALVSGPLAIIGLFAGVALALWKSDAVPVDVGTHSSVSALPPTQQSAVIGAGAGGAETAAATPVDAPVAVAAVHRRRSPLGRITFGAALAVAAVGAIIDANNGGRLHPEQWLGAAAVVCGLGLLVGTWRGRAHWLIVPGLCFAVAGWCTGEFARLDVPLGHAVGERYLRVDANSAHTDYSIRRGFSAAHIGIESELDRDVNIDAVIIAGQMYINVPDDVRLELVADTPHGSVIYNSSRPVAVDGGATVLEVVPTTEPPPERATRNSGGGNSTNSLVDAQPTVPETTDPQAGVESRRDQTGDVTPGSDRADEVEDGFVPTVHIDAHVEFGDVTVSDWTPWTEPAPHVDSAPPYTNSVAVTDQIAVEPNGEVLLSGGEVVIGVDNQVFYRSGGYGGIYEDGDVTFIDTSQGRFQLLANGDLIDPQMNLYNLDELRQRFTPGSTFPIGTVPPYDSVGTVPPSVFEQG